MIEKDELKRKLLEVDILRKLATYGKYWCVKNEEDFFIIEMKMNKDGCFAELKFSNKEMKEDKAIDLIDKINKNDEMVFLNRMYSELNELSEGMNKEECNTIVKLQEKINSKFKEIAKQVYPDMDID